jgi:hypothetical protein
MKLLHDYLLVKEVIEDTKLEGTSLNIKYDDSERFMNVEIVETSCLLSAEYHKYYPDISLIEIRNLLRLLRPGTRLVINRVAKTPYKDGLYFISFKDIIAITSDTELPKEDKVAEGQLSIYDYS